MATRKFNLCMWPTFVATGKSTMSAIIQLKNMLVARFYFYWAALV